MVHIDWAQMGGWASFVASVLAAVFVYGRLTQKVADHDHRILRLEDHADDTDRTLVHHGNELSRIKAHLKLDK